MTRRRILSSTSFLLLFTMGCYIYVPGPAGSSPPSVGELVRVEVTESEAIRLNLAEVLPGSPTVLQGELVSNADDAVEVLVGVVNPADPGFRSQEIFQRIEVRRGEIVRVTRRELSRTRTWLAVGAGAAFILSVVLSGLTGFVGGGTGELEDNKPD
jgi:hypothetical protein